MLEHASRDGPEEEALRGGEPAGAHGNEVRAENLRFAGERRAAFAVENPRFNGESCALCGLRAFSELCAAFGFINGADRFKTKAVDDALRNRVLHVREFDDGLFAHEFRAFADEPDGFAAGGAAVARNDDSHEMNSFLNDLLPVKGLRGNACGNEKHRGLREGAHFCGG